MVMGTLANLYAIQQTFSNTKTVDKSIAGAKDIIFADSIVNELAKQQLKNTSMFAYLLILMVTNIIVITYYIDYVSTSYRYY